MIKKITSFIKGRQEGSSSHFPAEEKVVEVSPFALAYEQARGELMSAGKLTGLSPDARVTAIERQARMVLARTK